MSDFMNDEVDRLIDEAAASMVAGEPRRVDAASIRRAIDESAGTLAPPAIRTTSSRLAVPIWFAIAAVLVAGFAMVLRSVSEIEAPRGRANMDARPDVRPDGAIAASSSPASGEPQAAPAEITRVAANPIRHRHSAGVLLDQGYEGLPRLTITPIDSPEALTTPALVGQGIEIPRIEISPLSISRLANEREH